MNTIPPTMDNEDEVEQEIWYSKPLNNKWELSKKNQKTFNKFFKNKTLSKDVAAYTSEVDGRPTLYLKNTGDGFAMSIGAARCEKPEIKTLTPYRNVRDHVEIPD